MRIAGRGTGAGKWQDAQAHKEGRPDVVEDEVDESDLVAHGIICTGGLKESREADVRQGRVLKDPARLSTRVSGTYVARSTF
jgi:hypothetical protein